MYDRSGRTRGRRAGRPRSGIRRHPFGALGLRTCDPVRSVDDPDPNREVPTMDITRRRFLEAAAAGAAIAPALGAGAAPKIPTRPFGETGLEVSILGFGSGSRFLMYEDEDKALEALSRAIDLG